MASTITALTGGGGVAVSGDTTGVLELKTNNGTTAMTIDTSQNVGIGTSSPSSFDATGRSLVVGSGSASQGISINSGTTGTGNLLFAKGTTGSNPYRGVVRYDHAADFMAYWTAGVERMRIGSTGFVTNAVNGLGDGLVQAQQYYRLNSGLAGANATGAQNIFGVGVTLIGSTVYEFEIVASLVKTAGTTSHTLSLSFGGTATLNNILYQVYVPQVGATAANSVGQTITTGVITQASATQLTIASTAAAVYLPILIKGTVSINAGGTFIPQYTLSAAPGGAYTTQIGSYIKISPLGASGANTSIGTWA